MRVLACIVVSFVALLFVFGPDAAGARGPSQPRKIDLNWRVVASGFDYVAADDRYVAIEPPPAEPDSLTLIDEQTGTQQSLSPPACRNPWYEPDDVLFGGRWMLVLCGEEPGTVSGTSRSTYDLYDLRRGQWSAFRISPQCQGRCSAVGIGSYWVKVWTDDGVPNNYPPSDYYLQNIATGQLEHDAAQPGGRVLDDLSTSSGSAPLCSPLRYPSVSDVHSFSPYLGSISFSGRIALTFGQGGPSGRHYRLRRCGSNLNLSLVESDYFAPPVISSRAVIWTPNGDTLDGRWLPSLQQFELSTPVATHAHTCTVGDVTSIALTTRRIYVTLCAQPDVWTATLPRPPRVRCIVPKVKRKTLTAARTAVWRAHCQIGRITRAYSARVKTNRVISQEPAPGTIRPNGTKVQLLISRGKRR